ncbi:uncharacterized protein LOC130640923 [Hydractinia symbiolongicarpus]|uniref:uncharacterized protein LOC130640923 n=1 Tax=Hydractinia symbiolongicarpus TaxID=13093 RepID=UPI00254F65DA|nr:uncharacterized protein LOC130640923 [Hydractinia symbiolongicarpus]
MHHVNKYYHFFRAAADMKEEYQTYHSETDILETAFVTQFCFHIAVSIDLHLHSNFHASQNVNKKILENFPRNERELFASISPHDVTDEFTGNKNLDVSSRKSFIILKIQDSAL